MATVLLSHALRYDLDVTSPDLLRRNSETYPDLKTKKRQRTLQHGRRNWSGRGDSNPRPQPWQGCALPLSYTRILAIHIISGEGGGKVLRAALRGLARGRIVRAMSPQPCTPDELFLRLDAFGIAQRTYHHPPVFTVAE